MRPIRRTTRRGTVLPLVGVCLIGLFAFVALAVDLGLLAVNRTECQNAADIAALASCRTLNNKPGVAYNNLPQAVDVAKATANANPLHNQYLGDIPGLVKKIEAGQFSYDTTSQTFGVATWTDVTDNPQISPASGSWTAIRVTLNVSQPTYFMKVMGVQSMPSGAVATAVHRPRDVAFVLDMTGSMAYACQFNYSVSGVNKSMNPDTMVPGFGHYVNATIRGNIVATSNTTTSSNEAISRNNYTITTPGGPPVIRNFYFDPVNIDSPATVAYPITSDTATLKNAFHRWSPSESGGDSTNYVGVTYDFAGYNATHKGNEADPKGPVPAPDTFGSMTDSTVTGVNYVGDRWRRGDGSINKTDTTWATTAANTRAAYNAADLLGYTVSGSNIQKSSAAGSGAFQNPAAAVQFRDPVWETHGYDLDIPKYRDWRDNSNTGNPTLASTYLGIPGVGDGLLNKIQVPDADKFKGYSMGPGYWGKTFYIWPPDPRAPVGNPGDANYQAGDWRRRYFLNNSGGAFAVGGGSSIAGMNATLLNTAGGLTMAGSGYTINYPAVLKWIKSGPMVLPPNLRAGRVLYYSSIPDDVDTSTGTTQARLDKAFWRNYIDYVVGRSYTSSSYLYGSGDSWSSAARSVTSSSLNTWTGPITAAPWTGSNVGPPYMRYNDSPNRPRLHLWFGPLSMVDFLGNVSGGNWNPGTCYEAQCWQLKAGVSSVLDDIRNNHPNDAAGIVMFAYNSSTPIYKDIRVPMGQNFTALKNSLFYPKSLLPVINTGDVTSEIRPYNTSFSNTVTGDEIPNANGSTDPNTGLALAFNLLSPSSQLPAQYGTVKGRRGASKVVIFETDGVPNSYSNATFTRRGYDSWYSSVTNDGSPGNGVEPSMSRAVDIATQITKPMASTTTTNLDSGLSLTNAPAKVYPIGFGDLFDTALAPNATFRATAHEFLSDVGVAGKTLPSGTTTLPSGQVITGTYTNRINTLRNCLEQIFQSGVNVVLIE